MEGLKPHVVIDGTRKGAAPGSPTEYLVHVVYSAYTLNTSTATTMTSAAERSVETSGSPVAKRGEKGDARGAEGTNRSRSRSRSSSSSSGGGSGGGGGGSSQAFPPSSYSGDSYTVARRFSQFEKLHMNIKAILRASPSVGDSSIAFLPKMSVVKSFPSGTPSAVVVHTRSRYLEQYLEVCIENFFIPSGTTTATTEQQGTLQKLRDAINAFLSSSHAPAKSLRRGSIPWAVNKLQSYIRTHHDNEPGAAGFGSGVGDQDQRGGASQSGGAENSSTSLSSSSSPNVVPRWFSPDRARTMQLEFFGYLEKRGQMNSTWKRRWCELDAKALKYYKDDQRRSCLLGCIPLSHFTVVSSSSIDLSSRGSPTSSSLGHGESKRHSAATVSQPTSPSGTKASSPRRGKFEFVVHTRGRSLRCRVPEADLCLRWCARIREACARLRPAARLNKHVVVNDDDSTTTGSSSNVQGSSGPTTSPAAGPTGSSPKFSQMAHDLPQEQQRQQSPAGSAREIIQAPIYSMADLEVSSESLAEGTYGLIQRASLWGTPVVVKSARGGGVGTSTGGSRHPNKVAVSGGAQGSGATGAADQLANEIRALQQLRHPNIVLFLGLCSTTSASTGQGREAAAAAAAKSKFPRQSLVIEYCENSSLWNLLRNLETSPWAGSRDRQMMPFRAHLEDTPTRSTQIASHSLRSRTMLRILRDVCAGMACIHANGLVHRDLKSSNILLDRGLTAKVADLGLVVKARSAEASRGRGGSSSSSSSSEESLVGLEDSTGQFAGTLEWMAPELVEGSDGGHNPAVDVYSFGVVASEVLSGRAPYSERGESKLKLVASILDEGVMPDIPAWAHSATPVPVALPGPPASSTPVAQSGRSGQGGDSLAKVVVQALCRDPRKRPAFRRLAKYFGSLCTLPPFDLFKRFDIARVEHAVSFRPPAMLASEASAASQAKGGSAGTATVSSAAERRRVHRRQRRQREKSQQENAARHQVDQPSHRIRALREIAQLATWAVQHQATATSETNSEVTQRNAIDVGVDASAVQNPYDFSPEHADEVVVLLVPTLQLLTRLVVPVNGVSGVQQLQGWVSKQHNHHHVEANPTQPRPAEHQSVCQVGEVFGSVLDALKCVLRAALPFRGAEVLLHQPHFFQELALEFFVRARHSTSCSATTDNKQQSASTELPPSPSADACSRDRREGTGRSHSRCLAARHLAGFAVAILQHPSQKVTDAFIAAFERARLCLEKPPAPPPPPPGGGCPPLLRAIIDRDTQQLMLFAFV